MPDWAGSLDVPEVYEKDVAHYAAQAKHFVDALAAARIEPGGPAARGFPTAAEALAAHRIVDAAYRSAATGSVPVALREL